jgi:HPt (histidine-containing phosphotransfer) domain-containing protein
MDGYVSKPIRIELLRKEIQRVAGSLRPQEEHVVEHPNEKKPVDTAFDFSELLTRVDHDRELLVDLLTIFKEEFPRHLLGLREAIASADPTRIAGASHTLKGMLSNLAAVRAAKLASQIEQLARQGQSQGFADLFMQFETETRVLLPQLEAYVTEVRP